MIFNEKLKKSGYVGNGMLAGAVAGSVFASPPKSHILQAITHLHKYYKGFEIFKQKIIKIFLYLKMDQYFRWSTSNYSKLYG